MNGTVTTNIVYKFMKWCQITKTIEIETCFIMFIVAYPMSTRPINII